MTSPGVLFVIAPNEFRDEELVEPYTYLTGAGWHATIASTQTGEAKGMLGKTITVTETLDTQSASDYDALVIVGGMGSPTYLWQNPKLHQLIREFDSQKKVVSAICLSGAVLAISGVLKGKKATVWEAPESLKAFKEAGAVYVKEDVVIDGNIVTAPGPHAATPFAKAIESTLALVKA